MVQKFTRRQFTLATASIGIVAATAPAYAQKSKRNSNSVLARIEGLEIRKGGDGNPYSVVTIRVLQRIGAQKGEGFGKKGERFLIVKTGEPPKGAEVGARIIVSASEGKLEDLLAPASALPPGNDPQPFCCIPIIIIIIGDAPRPDPEPPEGGEGTDPDKDEDSDEDDDVDTDGLVTW